MKKLALSLLALLVLSIGTYAQCFTRAWSVASQDTMNFHITLATLDGIDLQLGDEIGIFDGAVCVGIGVLSQPLTGGTTLVIETLVDNAFTIPIDGYTSGNAISYQFCIGGELSNPAVVPTYINGSTIFAATPGRDSAVVELRAVNTAPTFTSIPITTAEQGTPYTYTATAEDFDGDDLTYSAFVLPTWLFFDVGTQVLSGTPGNDDVGDNDVRLVVSDGTDSDTQTFIIVVGDINDPPTFTSTPIITAEQGTAYTYTATAEDIDVGDILTFSALELPAWLLFDVGTQVLSGTPGNDDVGNDTVSLMVSDGPASDTQTFIIVVGNINDAPTFTSIPITTAEQGTEYIYTATAEDIDVGDILTFSALELPAWLLFDVGTQLLSGTPGNDDVGNDTVSLMVSDGPASDTQTFIIVVGDINDAPTFLSIPDTVATEDVLYSSSVTAEDIDGDTLIFSATLLPAWLLFDVDTQVLSGTPGNDDVGDDTVTLNIFDGTVNLDTTFVIEVFNTNDDPAFTSTPIITGTQGTLYTYTATAEDIDVDDTLAFSAPVLPAWLSFDTITHILSGTPGNDYVGDNSISLMINDGTVDVFQSFIIDVENVNDPPTFTSTPITEARPGVAYSYTVTAEDIDGDNLTFFAVVLPGWLTFNPSTQLLSATPSDTDVGDQFVTIRVSDGSAHADQTFVITVDYGNHAPNFISDPATSITVGDSYVYTILAYDIDGDELTYSAPLLPSWLTFYPETHVISGIPRIEDVGRHDVTVQVSDGTVAADQSFPVTVEEENIAPIFTSTPSTSVLEGSLYVYYVEAEDGDDDDLTFSATLLPDWLSFDVFTGILHGTPDNADIGDHNVTLSVSDGDATTEQNFTITVEFRSGVGIFDLHSPEFMMVYPNPSKGRFIVALSGELEKELSLEIMDPLGKVLIQQVFPPYQLIREEYNLGDRPAGMYFIRVKHDSDQLIRKLILQ